MSKIQPDGKIVYQINGGLRNDNQFFYVNQIAVNDDGYLFLLDETRDEKGFYVLRERILLYSPQGKFLGVLHEINYPVDLNDPTLVQRGRINKLAASENRAVTYYILEENEIIINEVNFAIENDRLSEGSITSIQERKYTYPDTLLNIADIIEFRNSPVVTLRNGTIKLLSNTGREDDTILFSGQRSSQNSKRIVPWELASDSQNNIFFVDLESRAIRDLNGNIILDRDRIASATGIEDFDEYDYYRLDISDNDILYTTNDVGVVSYSFTDGSISFEDTAEFSQYQILIIVLWWVSLLVFIVSFILLLRVVYVKIFNRKFPQAVIQAIAVIAVVTVIGGMSTFLLIDNFNSRYTGVIFQRISQMIQLVPLVIDGDDFEELNSQADFGNPAYMSLRQKLIAAYNQNKDEWNKGYYFAIYRIIDDRLYGLMYLNGQIGMFHPFDWLEGAENPGIYDLTLNGEIGTEMIQDITGEWIYGVGPIYNSAGEVVGIFETGTDLYTLTVENRALIIDLIWELVTVWIVLMLLLVEVSALTSLLKDREMAHMPYSLNDQSFSDGNLARPLVFLYFTAVSFSISFLPLFSRDLAQALPSANRDILIALPLSLEMAFFGAATVVIGLFTKHYGWRSIFSLSLFLTGSGLLLSALSHSSTFTEASASSGLLFSSPSHSYYLLIVARSITGFGTGMGYIALRSFINLEGRDEIRNKAYSNFYSGMIGGINVGLVLGASLAAWVGYSNVFVIGLVLLIVTAILFATLYRDAKFFWPREELSDLTHRQALFSLIKSPRLWVYFIFLLLPTYAAAAYVGFYFPLFGENVLGLSTSQIGRFMIMNGLLIVYLGPPLSRFIERKIGNYWGSVLGSIFWGLILVIAGLTGNIFAVAIVLILMGLTEGFAVSTQNGLYFSEKIISVVGQDRSTGYFEFFGKIGDTIGPVIFASVLMLGARTGLITLGIVIATMTVPYILFIRNPDGRKKIAREN